MKVRFKKKIYNLVFADEFTSQTLNSSEWVHNDYTDDDATRSESQMSMSGEAMIITSERRDGEDYGFVMRTKKLFSRGYFEARMKLSEVAKVHSTFWINGFLDYSDSTDLSNEVDIFETFGSVSESGEIDGQGMVHCWQTGENGTNIKKGSSGTNVTVPMDGKFHIFALEWTETTLKFYIDGEVFEEIDLTSSDIFEPLLNGEKMAVLISAFSTSLSEGEKSNVETDYVRVYQYS